MKYLTNIESYYVYSYKNDNFKNYLIQVQLSKLLFVQLIKCCWYL